MTHHSHDSAKRSRLAIGSLVFVAAALTLSDTPAAWTRFDLYLWPDGRVPYRFADATDTDWWGYAAVPVPNTGNPSVRQQLRTEMNNWERAMTIADPADPARTAEYIRFELCAGRCENEDNYVLIRMNNTARLNSNGEPAEDNNMCSWRGTDHRDQPGRHRDVGGVTVLHFAPGLDANTLRHELGHCLGLWHEFGRPDRDFWLDERPRDVDGTVAWRRVYNTAGVGAGEMPELGNYDYDSIMHYGSVRGVNRNTNCVTDWRDLRRNVFNRRGLDEVPADYLPCRRFPADAGGAVDEQVSSRDKSRVLQYYAREVYPNWGFFESLNTRPGLYDYDGRPDPLLAPGVQAVGTPAVAYQSAGNHDVFVRGSDGRLYWKSFRRSWLPFEPQAVDEVSAWTSIGCCFGSDPAALSRGNGQIDVVIGGVVTGRPLSNHYVNGVWGDWLYVTGGTPGGDGVKQNLDGSYIGPAIASRGVNSLDVFVVRSDGRLAVTSLIAFVWQPWRTLLGVYNVTARPAAAAVSMSRVRLAVNEGEDNLYEPLVTFRWPAAPRFSLGESTATTANLAAPAITSRGGGTYRVFIVTSDNRIAHKVGGHGWRDIGGIPKPETGVSAAATGPYSSMIVMNGEDLTGCSRTCLAGQPAPGGVIQPGGLWLRELR